MFNMLIRKNVLLIRKIEPDGKNKYLISQRRRVKQESCLEWYFHYSILGVSSFC